MTLLSEREKGAEVFSPPVTSAPARSLPQLHTGGRKRNVKLWKNVQQATWTHVFLDGRGHPRCSSRRSEGRRSTCTPGGRATGHRLSRLPVLRIAVRTPCATPSHRGRLRQACRRSRSRRRWGRAGAAVEDVRAPAPRLSRPRESGAGRLPRGVGRDVCRLRGD